MSKPDKISMIAMAARAAGTSYGKYQAAQNPVTVAIPLPPLKEGEVRCKHCRTVFKKDVHHRTYCSTECLNARRKIMNRENMRSKRGG